MNEVVKKTFALSESHNLRHQFGISALVTQTSFCEGSSGDLAKRRLFSQAIQNHVVGSQYTLVRHKTWP